MFVTSLELPPVRLRHARIKACPPTHRDWDGMDLVSYSHRTPDESVIRGVLYVLGHSNAWLRVGFPILGVCNVDGVEMAALGVVENVAGWCYVLSFVFDPGAVVYGANAFGFFFDQGVGASAELG